MIKKIILLIVISFSFSKEHIAVIDFEAIGVKKSDAKALTQRITTELIKVDNYIVVERSQIDQMLKEQKFQYSGCIDISCAVDVGKVLGAKYIVLGTVSRFGQTYTLDARLVDVESSESIRSADYTTVSKIDNLLLEGVESIIRQLVGDYKNQDDEVLSSDNQNTQNISKALFKSYFRVDTEIVSYYLAEYSNLDDNISNGLTLAYDYAQANGWGAGVEFQFLRTLTTFVGSSGDFRFASIYVVRNRTFPSQLSLFGKYGLTTISGDDNFNDNSVSTASWWYISAGARYPISKSMHFECGYSLYDGWDYVGEDENYRRIYMGLTFIF